MTIAEITQKMIAHSNGNRHDINHFMKVYAFAKTIGEYEGLDRNTQTILEVAAIVHDIACPLCREKYGSTNGKYQELEGTGLTEAFLEDSGLPEEMISRIVWLVGHHHTIAPVEGIDHQILLEADYLVNADESGYSAENILNTEKKLFRTRTGIALLKSMYGSKER